MIRLEFLYLTFLSVQPSGNYRFVRRISERRQVMTNSIADKLQCFDQMLCQRARLIIVENLLYLREIQPSGAI